MKPFQQDKNKEDSNQNSNTYLSIEWFAIDFNEYKIPVSFPELKINNSSPQFHSHHKF